MHVRSVQRWRRAWSAGGETGLLSKGPVSSPILSDESLANFAKRNIEGVKSLAKTRLRRLQHRPATLAGFLAKTGLDLEPP